MLQNHCLAKAIADVGWGELVRQLQYKAAWYGRSVVAIDKWFPFLNVVMPADISLTPLIWMFGSGPALSVAPSTIGIRTLP